MFEVLIRSGRVVICMNRQKIFAIFFAFLMMSSMVAYAVSLF